MIDEWFKGEELESLAQSFFNRTLPVIAEFLSYYAEWFFTPEGMEYLKRYRKTKPLDAKKIPLTEWFTGRLWDLIYQALASAFLMGMDHVIEPLEVEQIEMANPIKISPEPLPFEEAISFFRARVPLTKEEWDELEAKLRFRAFTVARLTELDAINRVREKLLKVIEQGKTFQQFMAEGGEDELLRRAGFHRSNPWYWETVFRTNLQTAYNTGRRLQLTKDPRVLYYEFIGIRDSRQSAICRRRSGIIRPANDPFWSRNWPPLHHRCRSSVRPIYRTEAERRGLRVTPKRKLAGLEPPAEGFGHDPIESGSFWKLTSRMQERAERYGIIEEIKKLAKRLGLIEVEMKNPGTKIYPIELVRTLGTNRKAPVKVGDIVPKWEGAKETTSVKAIYKDFLNNEIWVTEFTLERHISRHVPKEWANLLKERIPKIFKNPDWVLYDQFNDMIYYVKEYQKAIPPNRRLYFCVVSRNQLRLYTAKNKEKFFQKVGTRFKILYSRRGDLR